MPSFKPLFQFKQKEIEQAFAVARPCAKINGLTLLQAPLQKNNSIERIGKLLIITPHESGKAHERNRIRRQLKAIFYNEQLYKNPAIFLLIVYQEAKTLSFSQLKTFLTTALRNQQK